MRIGLALPQYGVFASTQAIIAAAMFAEEEGLDSLWVGDRLLVPTQPRVESPGGAMKGAERFLDPLTVLTVAAGVTERVRLGTNTLNAPLQPPMLLARTLASLDQVSAGRLDVGLGLGWSPDEYEAVGVPWRGRGARLEETLDILESAWTDEAIEHRGALWTVPRARIDLKPAQHPRPPILLGGFVPATLERVGRRADGWLAGPVPAPALASMWNTVRRTAEKANRDPAALRLVVRVNPKEQHGNADAAQVPRHGTVTQIASYLADTAAVGATEVVLDLQQRAGGIEELLELAAELNSVIREHL
ncbi:TIGR03619 family F420-dependent LLM class oxidoreductase [Nocardia sp. NPDC052566]|uniref:TIGR03619 family F420-dependent LLM class oxidoreductase n=1 Tax=Nocardia sp. NPDC052566 TaxID=3364330 RepID=UPI0037C81154